MTGCATYRSSYCGFLGDLSNLWLFISITLAVFALIVVPFAVFYYEAYDMDLDDKETSCCKQACQALRWTFVSLFVGAILFFIGFMFLRTIRIPIQALEITSDASNFNVIATYGTFIKVSSQMKTFTGFTSSEITMDATIAVWLIAFVCFIGW